jgi:hypothetical protein
MIFLTLINAGRCAIIWQGHGSMLMPGYAGFVLQSARQAEKNEIFKNQ